MFFKYCIKAIMSDLLLHIMVTFSAAVAGIWMKTYWTLTLPAAVFILLTFVTVIQMYTKRYRIGVDTVEYLKRHHSAFEIDIWSEISSMDESYSKDIFHDALAVLLAKEDIKNGSYVNSYKINANKLMDELLEQVPR